MAAEWIQEDPADGAAQGEAAAPAGPPAAPTPQEEAPQIPQLPEGEVAVAEVSDTVTQTEEKQHYCNQTEILNNIMRELQEIKDIVLTLRSNPPPPPAL